MHPTIGYQRRLGALARGGSRGREPCADEREQVGDIVSLANALLEVFTVGRGAAVDGHFVLGGVFERTVLVAAVLVACGVVVDGTLHAYGVLGITNCNGIVQELSWRLINCSCSIIIICIGFIVVQAGGASGCG